MATHMEVCLQLNNDRIHAWKRFRNGCVKGYAFVGTTLLSEEEIYRRCVEARANNRLKELLLSLNGHFSIVLTTNEQTVLVADKLKSWPLFYFKTSTGYTIADLGETVLSLLPSTSLNPTAVKEYVAAGYVSGNKTLLQNCQIVPNASFVTIDKKQITETRYYSQHQLPPNNDTTTLTATVNAIVERMMQRMRLITRNRPVAIALSSGYDSRLIACLCKKFNIPNVICYTYGISSSSEITTARMVAQKLKLPWLFVEYTTEKWTRLINSRLFDEYIQYGGNLNTIPHIQDLLAITELLNNHLIPAETVIMPGHGGDLIGGSNLPTHITKKTIGKKIYNKHFEISILKHRFRREITAYLDSLAHSYFPIRTKEDCLQAFYQYYIRTLQANFIINSVRAYELKGLDWYLPLWDDEFEQFWNGIPCQKRVGAQLYNEYLFKEYFEPFGVDFYKRPSEVSQPPLRRFLRNSLPAGTRFMTKKILAKAGLYNYPKDNNALDIVGKLIMKKEFNKKNEYIAHYKTDSMCMKSLFYLSHIMQHIDNQTVSK